MRHLALEEAERRFLAYHEALNHSPKQLTHYRSTFKNLARFLAATCRPPTVGALTSETAQAFVAWLKATPLARPYRGTTERAIVGVHGNMKDLRAFVRWCAEEGIVDWKVRVPLPRLPETFFPVLSEADLLAIFSSPHLTGRSEYATRNRALLALLLDTGIRLGELAGLAPADLVARQGVRVVGKGGKERFAPFTEGVATYLDEWLALRGRLAREGDPLFLLKYAGITVLLRRIGRDVGVQLFAHKVRHTAATHLVRRNVDLHTVRKILGHTQLATTERYLSMTHEDLQVKHAAGSPFADILALLRQEHPQPARKRHRLSPREAI